MSETITGVFKYAVIPNDTSIPAAYRLPDVVTIAANAEIEAKSGYAIELAYTGALGAVPSVTNLGIVQAPNSGFGAKVLTGVLNNAGTLLGGAGTMSVGFGDPVDGGDGVSLAGGVVKNSGKLGGGNGVAYGAGGEGIYLHSGSFLNLGSGQVSGGTGGGDAAGGAGVYAQYGTLQNDGILRGGNAGGTIAGGQSNKALLGSYAGAGLDLAGGEGVQLLNLGQIIGGKGAIGGDGAEFTGDFNGLPAADFVNDGTINGGQGTGSGGAGLCFASYYKAGVTTRYGTFPAINSETFVNAISNAGSIIGGSGNISGGDGILNTGTLFLANSGNIIGGASSGQYNYGADGVSLMHGSVNNSGHITGGSGHYYGGAGIYIENAGTVVDSATISGGAGGRSNGFAVEFHAGASRLVLEHGAALIGGAAANAAASNVIELGAGTGSLSGIGVLFSSATKDAGITGFSSLVFDQGAAWTIAGTATGFAGDNISGFTEYDTLDVTGLAATLPETVTLGVTDALTIPKTGGGNISITFAADAGVVFNLKSDGHGGTLITDTMPCFCAGTRILTLEGEIPVEDLRVGDVVVTVREGGKLTGKIIWTGSQRVHPARHPEPELVRPIRILAGALGDHVPACDLRLSPHHALYLDGCLVEAGALVNGSTILREKAGGPMMYYHFEVEAHDVILAEGAACETYLDTGSRHLFGRMLHADFRAPAAAMSCAPRIVEGEALARVRGMINARAVEFGEASGRFLEKAPQKRF